MCFLCRNEEKMTGVALFLWTPSKDRKKEFILTRMREAFQTLGIETFQLDITSCNAFEELEKIDAYFQSMSSDKKRFVFSLDGDGFGLTLKMDGLWVDNIQYNVFTYLTKHPKCFEKELDGINSWYISILNCVEEGVDYIEKKYPHLDGMEYMVFPAFEGGCSNLTVSDRNCDVLLIADGNCSEMLRCLLENFSRKQRNVIIYGTGWEGTEVGHMENVQVITGKEQHFETKLELMGKSKVVLFFQMSVMEMADTDIISAIANGAVVFAQQTQEMATLFQDKKEMIFYHLKQQEKLCNEISNLLQNTESLQKIADAGKRKARQIGNLSCFAKKILDRCK